MRRFMRVPVLAGRIDRLGSVGRVLRALDLAWTEVELHQEHREYYTRDTSSHSLKSSGRMHWREVISYRH